MNCSFAEIFLYCVCSHVIVYLVMCLYRKFTAFYRRIIDHYNYTYYRLDCLFCDVSSVAHNLRSLTNSFHEFSRTYNLQSLISQLTTVFCTFANMLNANKTSRLIRNDLRGIANNLEDIAINDTQRSLTPVTQMRAYAQADADRYRIRTQYPERFTPATPATPATPVTSPVFTQSVVQVPAQVSNPNTFMSRLAKVFTRENAMTYCVPLAQKAVGIYMEQAFKSNFKPPVINPEELMANLEKQGNLSQLTAAIRSAQQPNLQTQSQVQPEVQLETQVQVQPETQPVNTVLTDVLNSELKQSVSRVTKNRAFESDDESIDDNIVDHNNHENISQNQVQVFFPENLLAESTNVLPQGLTNVLPQNN